MRLEKPSRVRRLAARHILGRARHDDPTAGVSAFGAQIDDVIGGLDDVHVMLDEDDRVAGIHELVERHEQPLDVGEV